MTTPKEQRNDAVREAATLAVCRGIYGPGYDPFQHPEGYDFCEKIAASVLAAIHRRSQPSPASSTARGARGPVMRVTASLVAAISILRRAHKEHKEPRKVIASDKMFLQMLADYEAAVEAMRPALSPLSGEPASLDDAYERAADIADGHVVSGNDQWCAGADSTARKIARAIRALKSGKAA